MKLTSNKIFSFMLAAVFALTLAGCGGGGGTAAVDDDMDMVTPEPTLTPEEMCAADGGRFEADGMCTPAEDVASEAVEAATKAAATKVKAIGAEADQMTDAGIGGSAEDGSAVDTYMMTIKRDSDGTTVKIDDSANPRLADDADEDAVEDPQFALAMDLGGGRTMHVRAMEADDDGNVEEEVVIVQTDIEAPKATAFAKVEMLDARKDRETATEEDPNDSLTVAEGADDVNLPKIGGFAAASGSSVVHTYMPSAEDADTDTPGEQPRDAAEVMGTYNGAMGTYTCDGNDNCTVTVNGKGEATAVSAGWTFTPAAGATIDVADADYLHYGAWLKKTTDADGTTYNEVETFAGSSLDASDGNQLDAVEGNASYEGGATGVYVKNVHKSDGKIESATSGHFTANASLMVYFGGDDVAVNKQNTVTGSISNFGLSGGEENAWSVALKGTRATGANMITGTANGGGAEGMFSGTFHGPTEITEDDEDPGTNRDMPGAVVGEFGANFSNGTVAGGFGARKQ